MEKDFKKIFYQTGITLEGKSCKILLIMYGLSDQNGIVKTSLNDLHQRAKVSKSTIRSALKELEVQGILLINHNKGLESEYKLLFI